MLISFDPAKNERNIAKHGVSFELAPEFQWSGARIDEDTREDYGEKRFEAVGFLGKRLHVLIFTPRSEVIHIISFRKANSREVKRYEEQK